ncbi:hypothetical protein D3C83_42910 [compost metagenome]
MVAGAVNVAPLAGAVSDTAGGWFDPAPTTETPSCVEVMAVVVLWLVTARPT